MPPLASIFAGLGWTFPAGVACVALLVGGFANAQGVAATSPMVGKEAPAMAYPDWSLGTANAPVTIIEYASLTCGHCAAFHHDIFPTIKQQYIDKGKVRFILRPLPTGPVSLSVALHALTLCAGPTKHYDLVDAFFTQQGDIFRAAQSEGGAKAVIFATAERAGGLTDTAASACVNDMKVRSQIKASADSAQSLGISGTPSFLINGTKLDLPTGQSLTVANVSAAIDAALLRQNPAKRTAKATSKVKWQ